MRALCFTVDLDRDANIPIPGTFAAGSMDRGEGTAPRFVSSGKGAGLLAELFDDLGIEATFFAEARTLHKSGASDLIKGYEVAMHGLDHEDLTGERTHMRYDYGDLRETTERSVSLIRDCVGTQPKGYRAPYMAPNEDMLSFLGEYGIIYDSSYYSYLDGVTYPYRSESGLIEIPVPKSDDVKGPITGYLWPMHEGTRDKEDFVRMAQRIDDGVLVLATHSWHICETTEGILDQCDVMKNMEDIQWILETLLDDGFEARTMSRCPMRTPDVI